MVHEISRVVGFTVMYDFAVVDSFALEMSTQGVVDDRLIQITSFPDSVIGKCALELMKDLSSLYERYDPSELYWLSDDWNHSELFEMPDKKWADALGHRGLRIPSILTDSNNSPARALFYLELAGRAGVPLLLSPQKDRWVTTGREKVRQFAHELVVSKVETQLQARIDDQITGLFSRTVSVPLAPVSRMILRRATDERKSLLDVAIEIRESREAKTFRNWLVELNKALASGYEAGLVKAHAELKKLESLVDAWLKVGDVKQGIEYEPRSVNIGEIPVIGWIVKMAGIRAISVNDPILNPNRVYRFISQWYS
jgi:hypothetical protein